MMRNSKILAAALVVTMLAMSAVPFIGANESDAAATSITPGSWTWDATTGMGPFNSFYAAFDMTNGNAFYAVLNPNDLSKTISGSSLSPMSNYNIMWVIPTVYWSVDASGDLILSNDSSSGIAYAHTLDGHTYNYIAIGVYEGGEKTVGGQTVLTSESGVLPAVNKTRAAFRTEAHNYAMDTDTLGASSVSGMWNFYQWELFKYCSLAVMEDFNSQNLVGNGHVYTSTSTYAYRTGETDSLGPYAGNPGVITDNATAASYGSDSVKLFIENAWGGVYDFVDGIVVNANQGLYIDTKSTPTDTTTTGTDVVYVQKSLPSSNYYTDVYTDAEIWGLQKSSTVGTATIGVTDYIYTSTSGSKLLFVGGSAGSDWSDSVQFGMSYAFANAGLTYTNTSFGARLAFAYDGAGAAPVTPENYSYKLDYDASAMTSGSAAISVSGMDPIGSIETYDVTIAVSESGWGSVDVQSVSDLAAGTAVTISDNVLTILTSPATVITATPATDSTGQYDYAFSTWQIAGQPIPVNYTISADTTITAVFTRSLQTYTTTIQSNNTAWGTVSQGTVDDVPYGSVIHIDDENNSLTIGEAVVYANPAADTVRYTYAFTGFDVEDGDIITGDQTIIATFSQTEITHTVSVHSSDSSRGSASPAVLLNVPGGTYFEVDGLTISLGSASSTASVNPATAQYTYSFTGWFNAASGGTQITDSTQVLDDMDVYAVFGATVNTYVVTWSISGTETTEEYEYGATPAHADPVAPEGYYFAGWDPAIVSVTADATYTAVFDEAQPVTVTLDPAGGSVSANTIAVTQGQPIGELPTPTRMGFDFDGWFTAAEGGVEVTADTIVAEDMTIYAHWEITSTWNTYKILVYAMITLLFVGIAVAILRNYVGGDRF